MSKYKKISIAVLARDIVDKNPKIPRIARSETN